MCFLQQSLLCRRDLQEPNLCLWDGQILDGRAAGEMLWVHISVWEDKGWAGRFFVSCVCLSAISGCDFTTQHGLC